MRSRALAVALLTLGAAAAGMSHYASSGAKDARGALVDALVTLQAGNYSAARTNAQAAVRAAPQSGMAHAVLARAYLELGEGLAADAEIGRARAAGMPEARLHQLVAHAAFLQGDYQRAVAEARKTTPRYADYATRVAARAEAMRGETGTAVAALSALVTKRPDDANAWADLGRVQLSAGEVGNAAVAAARAVALAPKDPVALTLQGEVIRQRFGLIASLPWFEAALRRDAFYHPALIEYAATLGDLGRYRDMLAATRKARASRPDSAQALYLNAVLAARAGKLALARDLLGRTAGAIDTLPGAVLLSGSLDLAEGKTEQAIVMFRRVVALQPMNVGARKLLGAALLRSGDAGAALAMLAPIATRTDADAYTLALAARALEASGDRQAATATLDRMASARPGPAAVFASDTGLAAISAAAMRAPDDPNFAPGLIRAELADDNLRGALHRARRLAEANLGAPAAQLALGDVLVAARDYDAAVAAFSRAADLTFDEPTMLRLVDALERTGRARDAAAALALFLAQNRDNLTAHKLLGQRQRLAGLHDSAIATLERVRRRVGNRDAALLADLAAAYAAAGQGEAARHYGREAYALAPLDPAVIEAYGLALESGGDREGAAQLRSKLAALIPQRH